MAATSWTTFLGVVRLVLFDYRGERLSETQYLTLANLALKSISRDFPRRSKTVLTVDGAASSFALPEDFERLIEVQLVVDSASYVLKPLTLKPGDQLRTTSGLPEYRLNWPEEDLLSFSRAPKTSEATTLYYMGAWPAITQGGNLPFGGRSWLEEALTLYIGYLAFLSHAAGRALNEQWAAKPELAVDNPLDQQARLYFEQYQRLIAGNANR